MPGIGRACARRSGARPVAGRISGFGTGVLRGVISAWQLGHTNVSGQQMTVARVGEAAITFAITDDRMRSFWPQSLSAHHGKLKPNYDQGRFSI